jgi:two-component system, OmpR family, sensor histidine kinase VicK
MFLILFAINQYHQKKRKVEDGIPASYIELIRDPVQIRKRAREIERSARDEILLYSTANALYRQAKLGVIQDIEGLAMEYGLKIRVLTPSDDSIKQLVQELGKYADIRYIPEELQTNITIAIVDRKSSDIVEMKDDAKNSSYEPMGLGSDVCLEINIDMSFFGLHYCCYL